MKTYMTLAAASAMLLAGCTTTGQTERNAAYGAAAGAVAGAVIGNNVGDGDAGKGAVAGAVIGGVAGGVAGCAEAEDCSLPGGKSSQDIRDTDGDGRSDQVDRYPNDRYRW
jgi:outer membrane lipoprotein SlyB